MARPDILGSTAFEEAFLRLGTAPLALAALDLDHFSEVNARLGNSEGDQVLRVLERLLSSVLPTGSIIGRLGGDEYAVTLPETAAETALILFDEVVKRFHIHRDPQWPKNLGISIGIAARPAHALSYNELYRAAEEALLRAKREGRGRTCIYTESKMVLKSNYYSKNRLDKLSRLAKLLGRSEASLLREALDELIELHRKNL